MNQVTFDRVLALNKELAALADAGVPLELGAGGTPAETVLDKASTSLALRTSLGQPLDKALQDNPDLPGIYRHAVESGVRSGDFTAVLDGVTRQPLAEDELRRTFGQSLVQPLILLSLAYVGFFVLCLRFSPALEGIYSQLGQEPSIGVAFLRSARESLPLWGPVVPVVIALAVWMWRSGRGIPHALFPWAGRYEATVAQANFADQLATLLETGSPPPEALALAGGMTDNRPLVAAALTLATASGRGETLAADDSRLRGLPPLLRWALTGDLGGQPLPQMLRFAAQTYRQSAERQAAVWQVVLPTLVGAAVGGAIVFAYALSMFGPLIRMLKDLAA